MQLDDCFELGYIVKPHGTKGEVQVFLDVDNPEEYIEMESVLVAHGTELVPFFIDHVRISGKNVVVKFEEIATVEEARDLRSKKLYLPLDLLPELDEGQFYYHEIIGYVVVDQHLGPLGKVKETILKGHQDLLVMNYKDTEVLIPIVDDVVLQADREKKTLSVNLPDGLIDIYFS